MAKSIIRSHRARVVQANCMLKKSPIYQQIRVSLIDREAFVEFYLLEDIVNLYSLRLKAAREAADDMTARQNIEKFSAIIDIFNAAIGAAQMAIRSGDYKKVWKAIHEGALMMAAKDMRHLPELKKMGIELVRELCDEMESEAIEELIRAAEAAIPDRK